MYEFTFYTFADSRYFESLHNHRINTAYIAKLKPLLPEDWSLFRSDVWLQANPPEHNIPQQGFKIHLSSSPTGAETMLRQFVPVCVDSKTPFKIVADPILHQFLNSKRYARAGAGKFATIYPRDEEHFLQLLDKLDAVTKALDGPYILSDKRYRDSRVVFYRYGGLQQIQQLRVDGTHAMMIRTPDGTLIRDDRNPYFQLPEWVTDPTGSPADAVSGAEDLLHGRYAVEEALNFTNTGGVYRAIDRVTGRTVVIKEARPHTLLWANRDLAVDAVTALRHEHACLKQLQGLPFVPELIESFEEWEHTFLVTSFCQGIPLAQLRAREEFILLTRITDSHQTTRFCSAWRDICLRLLDALEIIHARGVVLGDISPGNLLRDSDTGEITFIDFESAQLATDAGETLSFGTHWFNPGFRKPERRTEQSLAPCDDHYAAGMLLYNLLCPIQTIFELDKQHPTLRILDYFVRSGLPEEIRKIIAALLEFRPEQARRIAEEWDTSQYAAQSAPEFPSTYAPAVAMAAQAAH